MLQSLFPPKEQKITNQYRLVADGLEANVKRLIEMAADIDEQEKQDLI
jgi:hypothetical protein